MEWTMADVETDGDWKCAVCDGFLIYDSVEDYYECETCGEIVDSARAGRRE